MEKLKIKNYMLIGKLKSIGWHSWYGGYYTFKNEYIKHSLYCLSVRQIEKLLAQIGISNDVGGMKQMLKGEFYLGKNNKTNKRSIYYFPPGSSKPYRLDIACILENEKKELA